ncbi:MAG: DedA family protein [Blastocatellia bacterium]|nr:DedA family protein [Blastocatellia bacterium]
MGSIEHFINWLQQLPPYSVLALMFLIAYIENIFPPSPSDVLLVFTGTLIGIGTIDFAPSLIMASLGSTLGFMTAYFVGRYFEQRVISGRIGRFLPVSAIHQIERLFSRYGYGVIVANRFLAGTRAIVSVFAGMSKMNISVTTLLCAVSATLWNAILLYLGMVFAKNWRTAAEYLRLYSKVMSIAFGGAVILLLLLYFRRRRNAVNTAPDTNNK